MDDSVNIIPRNSILIRNLEDLIPLGKLNTN